MNIYLIRHGLTKYNERKAYMGWTDLPLCIKGIDELKELKKRFHYPQGQLLVSSPLKRCRGTFKLLYPNQSLDVLCDDIMEMNFGSFEGKTYDELKDDLSYKKWIKDIYNYKIPQGESYSQFKSRVLKGFHNIIDSAVEEHIKDIVIITHGGVIRSIMSAYVDSSIEFFSWKIPHGDGYRIELSKEDNKVIKYNSLFQ